MTNAEFPGWNIRPKDSEQKVEEEASALGIRHSLVIGDSSLVILSSFVIGHSSFHPALGSSGHSKSCLSSVSQITKLRSGASSSALTLTKRVPSIIA